MKKILFLAFLTLFFSCNFYMRESGFEKNVMSGLFLHVMDTVSYKQMYLPDSKFDEDVAKTINDTTKQFILVDSIRAVKMESISELKNYYKNITVSNTNNGPAYKFDYKEFIDNRKYIFTQASKTKLDSLQKIGGYSVNGIISLSRIQFDDTQKFGVFTVDYSTGARVGRGFLIFIKMENGKWVIDKVKQTWVS